MTVLICPQCEEYFELRQGDRARRKCHTCSPGQSESTKKVKEKKARRRRNGEKGWLECQGFKVLFSFNERHRRHRDCLIYLDPKKTANLQFCSVCHRLVTERVAGSFDFHEIGREDK